MLLLAIVATRGQHRPPSTKCHAFRQFAKYSESETADHEEVSCTKSRGVGLRCCRGGTCNSFCENHEYHDERNLTYCEAKQRCNERGMNLCTKEVIEKRCPEGTTLAKCDGCVRSGCNHDRRSMYYRLTNGGYHDLHDFCNAAEVASLPDSGRTSATATVTSTTEASQDSPPASSQSASMETAPASSTTEATQYSPPASSRSAPMDTASASSTTEASQHNPRILPRDTPTDVATLATRETAHPLVPSRLSTRAAIEDAADDYDTYDTSLCAELEHPKCSACDTITVNGITTTRCSRCSVGYSLVSSYSDEILSCEANISIIVLLCAAGTCAALVAYVGCFYVTRWLCCETTGPPRQAENALGIGDIPTTPDAVRSRAIPTPTRARYGPPQVLIEPDGEPPCDDSAQSSMRPTPPLQIVIRANQPVVVPNVASPDIVTHGMPFTTVHSDRASVCEPEVEEDLELG